MQYSIPLILAIGTLLLFLTLSLMKAVDIHKSNDEKIRDDDEQEEYIKQWRNKTNEKNNSN